MAGPIDSSVPRVQPVASSAPKLPVDSLVGDAALPLTSSIGIISRKGEYTISFDKGGVQFSVPKVTISQKGSPPSFATDESRAKLGAEFSKIVKEASKKKTSEFTWDWDKYKKKTEEGPKDVAGALSKKTSHVEEWFVIRKDSENKEQRFKIKFENGKAPQFFHNDKKITNEVLRDLKSAIPKEKAELEKHEIKRALKSEFEKWIDKKFPKLAQSTQPSEEDLRAQQAAEEAERSAELAKTLPPTKRVVNTDTADEVTAPSAIRSSFGTGASQVVEKAAPTSRLAKVGALTKLGRGLALAFGTFLTAIGGALTVTFTAIVIACKALGQTIGKAFGSIADAIAKKSDHKWRDKIGQAFSKPLGAMGALSVAIPLSISLGISEVGNALLEKSGNSKAAESMKRFRKFVMDFTITSVVESKYATDIPKVYDEYKERKPKTT